MNSTPSEKNFVAHIGTNMARHGVGGGAFWLATGGVGSSPAVLIRETRKVVLRRMLRVRDRKLSALDYYRLFCDGHPLREQWAKLDKERQAIRRKIKAHGST